MIGTLEEAQEIYAAKGGRYWGEDYREYDCPEGWRFIGSGSSRACFQGPSGAVYKIEHCYNGDDMSYNASEHFNFAHLKKVGAPDGWTIPESALYTFEAITNVYDPIQGEVIPKQLTVSVIALPYLAGSQVSYSDHQTRARMIEGMAKMGLMDAARGNALQTEDGFVLVDAAEGYLANVLELVPA